MSVFRDMSGREFPVVITYGDFTRVRKELGCDLFKLLDNKLAGLAEWMADPEKLVTLGYTLLQPRLERDNISPTDFALSLDGAAMESLYESIMSALVDFFPCPRSKEILRGVMEKGREITAVAVAKIREDLSQINPVDAFSQLERRFSDSPAKSA